MWKLISLTFLLFIIAGCTPIIKQPTPAVTPRPTFPIQPDMVILKLKRNNDNPIQITYQEIKALPQVTETLFDKEENGVRLLDLLQHYGITNFSTITLSGNGQSIELAKDQITEEVLLAYTKNYNLKLASPQIPKSQWIKTVMRIEVH